MQNKNYVFLTIFITFFLPVPVLYIPDYCIKIHSIQFFVDLAVSHANLCTDLFPALTELPVFIKLQKYRNEAENSETDICDDCKLRRYFYRSRITLKRKSCHYDPRIIHRVSRSTGTSNCKYRKSPPITAPRKQSLRVSR